MAAIAATITATGAACSRSGGGSGNNNSNTSAPATSSAAAANPGDFGTLKKICGPGNATGGSGRGITSTTIQLGTMADPGSTVAPGLGQEFFQVGDAFVKWCNAAGGINGRKIALTDYDAKLFNVAPEMIAACQKVFMLVGNGNGLDDPGAKPRTDCKLGAIPSYFVSPAATAAPYQVQPTPNPPNEFQVGPFRLMGLKYPQTKTSGIAVGSSNTASLRAQGLRTRDAVQMIGFKVADYSERPPLVTNWRPYMEEIKQSGAGGYMNATGSATYIAPELTAIKDTNLKLTWLLLGNAYYEPQTIQAVKSVGVSQPTYQYFSHLPFEMTDQPVVKQIKTIMANTPNALYTDFTALAFSAWALWAKSATACGNDLTQDCVLQKAGTESQWTAGGLFPPRNTDPNNKHQTQCYVIMDVTPNGFVYDKDVTQPNNGIYNCDPANVAHLTKTYQ